MDMKHSQKRDRKVDDTNLQLNSTPLQIGAYFLMIMVHVSVKPVSLQSFQQYSCQVHTVFYTHFDIMFSPRTCEQIYLLT